MAVTAEIDGVACTLEKMSDGRIRVRHALPAINALAGPDTDLGVEYFVHPTQRQQYEHFNALLPPEERSEPREAQERPWWSYLGAQREKGEAGE